MVIRQRRLRIHLVALHGTFDVYTLMIEVRLVVNGRSTSFFRLIKLYYHCYVDYSNYTNY